MDGIVFYPINDFGPLMKGLVIGGLGIVHVFLAQFAIGGGFLMCYLQWLAGSGREPLARRLLDSYFRLLVLLSFVVGALTGVGMWFTAIQISPRTIGLMVDEFHWVWATEYLFFWVEVVAGYTFYRYGPRLPDATRMGLLLTYSIAAWGSLFWINGILSWQLTPGEWLTTRNVWDGFFNPTFWPSLFYRTIVCLVLGGLAATIVVNTLPDVTPEQRRRLINRIAHLLVPMVAMPVFGLWFLVVLPPDSRAWVLGGSVAMTLFMNLAIAASLLIGGYAIIGLWRQKLYINGATATLLTALAFGATAGGEFVREGVRKPYTIRHTLYSNAITPAAVQRLREVGCTAGDPYPVRDAARLPNSQLRLGAQVFRNQCSICHTLDGVNGLTHLMGGWTIDQQRLNVAQLQWTKSFMPPFAGTARELEALVRFVSWRAAGRPTHWPESADPAALVQIRAWLAAAGVESATVRGHPAPSPAATRPAAPPTATREGPE